MSTHMNDTQRMLDALNSSFPDITTMAPLDARAAVDARIAAATNVDAVQSATDEVIGSVLPVRVYRPHVENPTAPIVLFAHGGGYLHGTIASHDSFCREWSAETSSIVVSVAYRLAPEATPLDAVDDMLTATAWVATQWPDRPLIVGGDSAGGGIAASTAITLRDTHTLETGTAQSTPAVRVAAQVLLYPFLDPHMRSDSYRRNAEGYFVTAKLLAYYWQQAIGTTPELRDSPRVNALLATHKNLPPAIVVTGGLDPLCDEGRDYARALADAGNTVTHRHYPDQFHGFATIGPYRPGQAARATLWSDLRALIASM